MKLSGQVVKQSYAAGTKSQHMAVMLDTGDQSLVLRRVGGNAFSDPELERLVGKRIEGEGVVQGSTFIMSSYSVLS
jgi:hypothetical protein